MLQRVFYTLPIVLLFTLSFGQVKVGAERTPNYLPLLKGKSIAVIVNPTSKVKNKHLVDTLISSGIDIKTIFAPEHGFRGVEDAGTHVANGKDAKTNLPIISLYGKNKKPTPDQLKGIDIIVFDIQDVGARFYTYISTMHYAMEAAAENGITFLILDRPNPHGMHVDGPVLNPSQKSFIGMHPIPILHGLTVGELATMVNSEKWLNKRLKCDLSIIKCEDYTHLTSYSLPIKPSPNLPNDNAVALYPSLCFFEGTNISVGRGTNSPFEVYGHPSWKTGFNFTPKSTTGASNPPYKDKNCNGFDLTDFHSDGLTLQFLINAYNVTPDKDKFFSSPSFFNRLAGNDTLIQQIKNGETEEKIRASWEPELSNYKTLRQKYLLYPESN